MSSPVMDVVVQTALQLSFFMMKYLDQDSDLANLGSLSHRFSVGPIIENKKDEDVKSIDNYVELQNQFRKLQQRNKAIEEQKTVYTNLQSIQDYLGQYHSFGDSLLSVNLQLNKKTKEFT